MSHRYVLTYLNQSLGKRCVLIDNVSRETADRLLAKFGDQSDPWNYLPELKAEEVEGGAK